MLSAVAATSITYATPASAGTCSFNGQTICGWVKNNLSSSYTVKVAILGSGSERCATWNAGTLACKTYWLPSGKSSSSIGVIDADAYMVESRYYHGYYGTSVNAFTWTKITDALDVNCGLPRGASIPSCTF
ncbi:MULTISPECIES: hypothetical protein [unclassified Micromonospora]|uniref:hypothetical protein n=1 Tax=unclassified Micromonospora TaxID=2617518 RepID=UPI002FF36AD4